jgi:PmbA protein
MAEMEREALLALCERGVEAALAAGAEQAEVFAESDTQRQVSFEKNDLNLVRVVEETRFGVRVITGGRVGFATSNRAEQLADAAAEAAQIARASPADPMRSLPEPRPVPTRPSAVDPALDEVSVEALAALGDRMLRGALAREPRLSIDNGAVDISRWTQAVASSRGVRAHWGAASASAHLMGMAIDGAEVGSFSAAGERVRRLDELDEAIERLSERFTADCVGALHPRKGESFRGPAIVPPHALMGFLMGDLVGLLCADEVRKGRSPFGERVGESIASALLSLVEPGTGLAEYPLTPFDREGMPCAPLTLIREGRLEALLFDSYEARLAGRQGTGHAAGGAGSLPGVGPAALMMAPGDTPLEALTQLPRGIWITRFSGSSNPVSGDFSGVVKGGFLIRDGEKVPVAETTVSGNLYEALKNISAISDTAVRVGGSTALPAIRFEDVSITAG